MCMVEKLDILRKLCQNTVCLNALNRIVDIGNLQREAGWCEALM